MAPIQEKRHASKRKTTVEEKGFSSSYNSRMMGTRQAKDLV